MYYSNLIYISFRELRCGYIFKHSSIVVLNKNKRKLNKLSCSGLLKGFKCYNRNNLVNFRFQYKLETYLMKIRQKTSTYFELLFVIFQYNSWNKHQTVVNIWHLRSRSERFQLQRSLRSYSLIPTECSWSVVQHRYPSLFKQYHIMIC